MAGYQGRQRPFDFTITASDVEYPFTVYRPRDVPAWRVPRAPDVAGQAQSVQATPRAYRSTHSGFGWGQMMGDNVYHYATNLDPRFPQSVILGPLVSTVTLSSTDATNGVTGIFEKGSYIYTLSGRYCNRIDPTNDSVAATGGFPADFGASTVSSVGVEFDGNIVIGFTSATSMRSFDGSSFTTLNGANVPQGKYLATFYEDSDERLAAVFLNGSDPSVAWIAQAAALNTGTNWVGYGGDYGVGDTSVTLTGLASLERTLFIATSKGLYFNDRSGRTPLIFPAMPRNASNGKNLMASPDGTIWYPSKMGLRLYNHNTGDIDDVSPGRGLPDRSGIAGTFTALAAFRAWTFVSVYDGTDSYIMAGRQREEGEPGFGPYIWHGALAKIASTEVKSMFISSLTDPPRLWLGLKTGNVAYIKLPGKGDNPLNDSNYRYAASGSLYYGADDFGVGGQRWQLQDVILEAEGLSSSTTVTVYERRDLGTWTIMKQISASGRTVITPRNDKRFNRVELRLDITNGSSSSTPVVRVLAGQALPRPSMRDIIQTTVVLDDAALSRLGIPKRYSAQDLIDQLKTFDSGAPYTIKHYWSGSETSETVQVISAERRMVYQEDVKASVYTADMVMKVVPSTFTYGAQFSSASSQYLSVADNADLSGGDVAYTIACYVKLTTKAQGHMVNKASTTSQREYYLYYDAGSDRFVFKVDATGNDTSTASVSANNFGSPTAGTWYFVVAWHDPTANTINIQVNNGTANSTAHTTGIFNSTSSLLLGGNLLGAGSYLNGALDNVGIWKAILTAAQKTTLYNNGIGLAYADLPSDLTTDLKAYYNLEEASGTRDDAHSNSYDLTDNNGVTRTLGPV